MTIQEKEKAVINYIKVTFTNQKDLVIIDTPPDSNQVIYSLPCFNYKIRLELGSISRYYIIYDDIEYRAEGENINILDTLTTELSYHKSRLMRNEIIEKLYNGMEKE